MDAPLPFVLRRPVVATLIAWLAIDGFLGFVSSVGPFDLEGPIESIRRVGAAGLAGVAVIALRFRAARRLRASGAAAPRTATPGALVALVIVFGLVAGTWLQLAMRPAAARPEAIEARFAVAIDRLVELARDRETFRETLEPGSDPPFDDPALIQAAVWGARERNSRVLKVVYDDGRRSLGGHSWFPLSADEPGERVANLWTNDGGRYVEYDRAVVRIGGRIQGFTLHLDLDALERP